MMQLSTDVTPEKVEKKAVSRKTIVAGEQLKVEVGEDDELDEVCPAGKRWAVSLIVNIVETNA